MKKFGNVLWGIVLIAIGIIFGLNALGILTYFLKGGGHCLLLYLVL